ncbi:MAG: hypothetical protein ABF876_05065 [Acetobacter aceti]
MTTSVSATWTQSIQGIQKAQTYVGDTLERIALRELGDASQWYVLAWLNGLREPWISDDPASQSETVLLAGQDTINVPSGAVASSAIVDQTDIFGTDVAQASGQIQFGSDGDLATVSGKDNLMQALNNRMKSRLRDLVYHPGYGNALPVMIGKTGSAASAELCGVFVARCICGDPRIDTVQSMTVALSGGTATVEGSFIAVGGNAMTIGNSISAGGS